VGKGRKRGEEENGRGTKMGIPGGKGAFLTETKIFTQFQTKNRRKLGSGTHPLN